MRIIFLLLLFPYTYTQTPDLFQILEKFWLKKDFASLETSLADGINIFFGGKSETHSPSKTIEFLKNYLTKTKVKKFSYNKAKSKKDRVVVDYQDENITAKLYFFTSYNSWSKVLLIKSIRQIPVTTPPQQKNKTPDSKTAIEVGYDKETLIDRYGDPSSMKENSWEYWRSLSMGCHAVYYITKYSFANGRVTTVEKREESTGCSGPAMW